MTAMKQVITPRHKYFLRHIVDLIFPPNHLVDDSDVALDDFHHLGADVLFDIVRHRDAMVAVLVHGDGGVYGLQKRFLVDSGYEEAGLVEGFRTLGRGADADRRERMSHGGEKRAFLGQRAAVRDNRECVHLEAVVVVEAQWLVLDNTWIKRDPSAGLRMTGGRFQALAAPGMAAVKDGHVILLSHLVDGGEEAQEVLFSVDVLLAMGAQKDVFPLLQAEPLMDVAGFDLRQVLMQDFRHRAAGDVGAFLR